MMQSVSRSARQENVSTRVAKFVELEAGMLACPFCEGELNSAIVVANTALVGLSLEMKVFRAESPEHAKRIAKSTIGKALRDIPLLLKDRAGTTESR